MRTGILDRNGKDTGVDPFMASYPHLIDVGIMGHCVHGKTGLCAKAGIGCYQSGMLVEQPDMTVEDFRWIAGQSSGRCNQFALGGRGDPDQHENFEEILMICREYNIVPNFTTSGYGMTSRIADLCKKYCGAVAVSWYRNEYTQKAIRLLLDAGVKTNIHYVLGKNSIDILVLEDVSKLAQFSKNIASINDISKITMDRNHSAWGEFSEEVADNDPELCELAQKVNNSSGDEQETALAEMLAYIRKPSSMSGFSRFGEDHDDFRYKWNGDWNDLLALAKRLWSGYGADEEGGREHDEIDFTRGIVESYAEYDLK